MRKHKFIPNRYTRFLAKLNHKGFDPAQCWEWTGAGKGNGYGSVSVARQNTPAHRVAYELFCGPVPEGADVCHTCDNRFCVNPDHLFVGSRQQNMDDMRLKGRGAGGARKHLKEGHVQEIRRRLVAGHAPRRIAEQMDVNYYTVTAIREGRAYGRVGQ